MNRTAKQTKPKSSPSAVQLKHYQDTPQHFEAFKSEILQTCIDQIRAYARVTGCDLIILCEDKNTPSVGMMGQRVKNFLATVPSSDHAHKVIQSLMPQRGAFEKPLIVLVVDVFGNCDAILING